MFGMLRISIGVILGVIATVLILKFFKPHLIRRLCLLVYVTVIVLITALGFVPFENSVYTFPSATAVYDYYHFGEQDAQLVVEGNHSDLVVGPSKLLIVPKSAKGWKIGIGLHTKRIAENMSEGVTVMVYRYKDTNDYFIMIMDTAGIPINVSDEYNTSFCTREDNPTEKPYVTYYAHIAAFDSQYTVTVNGKKIAVT